MKFLLKILIGMFNILTAFAVAQGGNLTPIQQCALYKVNFVKAVKFAKEIKFLLEKNNSQVLSTMVTYPLRINRAVNSYYFIKTPADFIQHYGDIFSRGTRIRILEGRSNDILCNDQGVALFSGTLWSQLQPPDNQNMLIFVINIVASK